MTRDELRERLQRIHRLASSAATAVELKVPQAVRQYASAIELDAEGILAAIYNEPSDGTI